MAWIRPLQSDSGGGGGGGPANAAATIRIPFTFANAPFIDSVLLLAPGDRVIQVRVEIDTAFAPGTTIDVGQPASPAAFMPAADNVPTVLATYEIDIDIPAVADVVRISIGGAPGVGSGVALITYTSPGA